MKCYNKTCSQEATWLGKWKHKGAYEYMEELPWCDYHWSLVKGDCYDPIDLTRNLYTAEDFWKETWS